MGMLAQNIKNYRKKLKLSQEKLAKNADITYSTLIKIESGANKNPTLETMQKLATALKVNLDQLVNTE